MCEELNREVQRGSDTAKILAEHLRDMGASKCSIPIPLDGKDFLVTVEETGKPKLGMYGERETLVVGKYRLCFFDGTPENGIWLELVDGEGFQLRGDSLEESLKEMFKKR